VRKILLAAHGTLAESIKTSLDMIVGESGNVDTLCAYTNDDFDLKSAVAEKLSALSDTDELVVVTDVFGGSINNEFMLLRNNPRLFLITGLNLALAVELSSAPADLPTKQVVEEAIQFAREGIIFCNELGDGDSTADEDF
jgi:fructoselysine and glucoselysine-specific PTS system IIA component